MVKFTQRFGKAPAKQIPIIPVFDELDEDAAVHKDVVDLNNNKNDVLGKFPSQRNPNNNNKELEEDVVDLNDNKNDVLEKFRSQRNPVNNDNDDDARDIHSRKFPSRKRKTPQYLNDYACYNVDFCYKVMNVPKTYTDALESCDSEEWKKAMSNEMESLVENNTFTVMPLPESKSTVGGGGGGVDGCSH